MDLSFYKHFNKLDYALRGCDKSYNCEDFYILHEDDIYESIKVTRNGISILLLHIDMNYEINQNVLYETIAFSRRLFSKLANAYIMVSSNTIICDKKEFFIIDVFVKEAIKINPEMLNPDDFQINNTIKINRDN